MKLRNGFVSNSSSSSFVCAVCGDLVEGWDGEYDRGVTYFDCGHEICSDHLTRQPTDEEMKKYLDDNKEEYTEETLKDDYQDFLDEDCITPTFLCPVCSLDVIDENQLLEYIMKVYKINIGNTRKEVKARFGNKESFGAFLRS